MAAAEEKKKESWVIERFNYLDENHDGMITLSELEEYHREFDPEMTSEDVAKEFEELDIDGDGKVRLVEFMSRNGIDVSNMREEDIEASRAEELEREAEIIARGVTAVEILPDGQEANEIQVEAEVRIADENDNSTAAAAAVAVVVEEDTYS